MPEPKFKSEKPPKKDARAEKGDSLFLYQYKEAQKIFKENFLGSEAVEKTFGIKLSPEKIAEIPFSKETLEQAKELGQFLILRTDIAPNGEPLTMKKMKELLQSTFDKENEGKKFEIDSSRDLEPEEEDFFTKETPEAKWSLVSKEIIPKSVYKNYFQQTELLVEYVEKNIDIDAIPEYAEAIKEFNDQKEEIKQLSTAAQRESTKIVSEDWAELMRPFAGAHLRKMTEKLAELKINKLTRQTPVEVLYDMLIYKQNNDKRLLDDRDTWTSRRDSSGRFVAVGGSGLPASWDVGVDSHRMVTHAIDERLGVSFSRSV